MDETPILVERARRLPRDHAQPPATAQRLHRDDAPGAQARAGRGGKRPRLPRAAANGRRTRVSAPARTSTTGSRRAARRRCSAARCETYYNPLVRSLRELPFPVVCRGQRRRRRRRRQYRARLRHRAGSDVGELRAGLRQDRAHSGFRRHLDPAAADRPGARARPRAHRRAAAGGEGRDLGADLADGRRQRADGRSAQALHAFCVGRRRSASR